MRKFLAVVVNIGFPGIGSLIVGKIVQGVVQFVLLLIAGILILTGLGAIVGIPLYLIALIWAIITAASWQPSGGANSMNIG